MRLPAIVAGVHKYMSCDVADKYYSTYGVEIHPTFEL